LTTKDAHGVDEAAQPNNNYQYCEIIIDLFMWCCPCAPSLRVESEWHMLFMWYDNNMYYYGCVGCYHTNTLKIIGFLLDEMMDPIAVIRHSPSS
jgi:hypothetical protein